MQGANANTSIEVRNRNRETGELKRKIKTEEARNQLTRITQIFNLSFPIDASSCFCPAKSSQTFSLAPLCKLQLSAFTFNCGDLTMNARRPDRIGVEKVNYDSHLARVTQAKTSVDCHTPRPHPLLNRGDVDQVSEAFAKFIRELLHLISCQRCH